MMVISFMHALSACSLLSLLAASLVDLYEQHYCVSHLEEPIVDSSEKSSKSENSTQLGPCILIEWKGLATMILR